MYTTPVEHVPEKNQNLNPIHLMKKKKHTNDEESQKWQGVNCELLESRKPIITNLGPIKRSYDPNKTVYTHPGYEIPLQKG